MKDFIDIHGNEGYKCKDGTLRVTAHYEKKPLSDLRYVRLENHNGKTVSIRADKIVEVIGMLEQYT